MRLYRSADRRGDRQSSLLPIRLAPERQSWLLDLCVGGWRSPAADTEQGLEGSHRRAPAVEPKDELVEVDLHLVVGDASVGASQPRLEVADHAVDMGQGQGLVLAHHPFRAKTRRLVVVTEPA